MSSKLETFRNTTSRYFRGILRLRVVYPQRAERVERAPVRMTTRLCAGILFAVTWVLPAGAQESPASTPSAISEESPAMSISAESVTPSPMPQQTPSASPGKAIRISFVPPPLEGSISLGIYDAKGKLVRVLHQEADLNEFKIGADALVTQWDGKNDNDEELPVGKYHARGYLVGNLKVEDLGEEVASPPENNSNASVKVKLMPNPLANDKQAIVELTAGFDGDGSYLETNDDLPLFTVSESPNVIRVSIVKKGDKSVGVGQDDGAGLHQFRVSNVDQMMAFDCGEIELK